MQIELQNDLVHAVADTFGGELISLTDQKGIEYLWGGDDKFWSGRSPHLFPIIGTLKNNETWINGTCYSMGKHGFARNVEYEIVQNTTSSITFLLRDNAETKQGYPFHFSLYVTHALSGKGFITTYRVVNEDVVRMPFCIGGHVGVKCPIIEPECFEDYEIIFDRSMTAEVYFPLNDDPMTKDSRYLLLEKENKFALTYELFEEGPAIMDDITSHILKLVSKKSGRGIQFIYHDFPVLALWTFGKKRAPYLCLEPWHGLPALLEDGSEFAQKPYIISLEPKDAKIMSYNLQIL